MYIRTIAIASILFVFCISIARAQSVSTNTCQPILRTLGVGSRGSDVYLLQSFLHISPTGYFGLVTERAVQVFQKANTIVVSGSPLSTGYGLVGTRTRAFLAHICLSSSRGTSVPNTPSPVSPITVSFIPTYTYVPGVVIATTSQTVPTNLVSCTFNGSSILNGQSLIAYSSSYGSSCNSEIRTCSNGGLSGSYSDTTCQVRVISTAGNPSSCTPELSSLQTQTLNCPLGQMGSITQTRTSLCLSGALTPTWSSWMTATNTCTVGTSPTLSVWAKLGLGEPLIDNAINKSWSIDKQLDAIIPLHPTIFRLWMSGQDLYDNVGNPISTNVGYYKKAIERLSAAHIPIIGMDNYFPPWMTGADTTTALLAQTNYNAIPCIESKDAHEQFLTKYDAYWKHLAQLFPQIQYWEPANETNGIHSLVPIQSGPGYCGKLVFSHDERVWITIELMERAHRAIKSVIPNAIILLPPIAPQNDELALTGPSGSSDGSLKTIVRFISDIYRDIAAWNGNARNYFDGVSWHPYIFADANDANWTQANEIIHSVMQSYGDGSIPVIFSEVGDSDLSNDPQVLANRMQDTMRLSQEKMPWVTYVVWFRAFNDQSAVSWGGEYERRFGIMQEDYPTFTKKPSTDVFCKFSGCVSEPFRAYSSTQGWQLFQYTLSSNSYCKYTDAEQYTAFTNMDYTQSFPFLASLDTTGKTYTGVCTR